MLVGESAKEEKDIVRYRFSTHVNPDERIVTELKTAFCDENKAVLFERLIINVTILKAVSYTIDNEELEALTKNSYFFFFFLYSSNKSYLSTL